MENHYLIQARTLRFWSIEEASKRVGVEKKTYERLGEGTMHSISEESWKAL